MAQIQVNCPHCQKTLVGEEAWKGEFVECPYCKQKFQWLVSIPYVNSNQIVQSQNLPKSTLSNNTKIGLKISIILAVTGLLYTIVAKFIIFIADFTLRNTTGKSQEWLKACYSLINFFRQTSVFANLLYNYSLLAIVIFAIIYINKKESVNSNIHISALLNGCIIGVHFLISCGYQGLIYLWNSGFMKLETTKFIFPISNFILSISHLSFCLATALLIISVSKYVKYKQNLQL